MKRIIPILLAALLLLSGCFGGSLNTWLISMNAHVSISAWGKDSAKMLQTIETLMEDLENTWTTWDTDSVISMLNRGEKVELTQAQQELLKQAEELSVRTGGAFDPKLLKVLQAWGFRDGVGTVPSQAQLEAALADRQWDLNGVMQGYAMDLILQEAEKLQLERMILVMDGNVLTYGKKEDGPWKVGIKDPTDKDINLAIAKIEGTMTIHSTADSGKYFEQDGEYYHHIMDPATGMPAESDLKQVAVFCKSGITADALSTALYVMGLEKATQFWRESDDFEAIFVTRDGKILATEGLELIECEFEVIKRGQ